MSKQIVTLNVNGAPQEAIVEANDLLLEVLREKIGLTGTKRGCATGNCGACTVLVDGVPTCACLTLAVTAEGQEITTVEGLAEDGQLHPLQTAFVEKLGAQCGFCTAGMLLSSKALLDANPSPEPDDIKAALSGNLCRCTGYVKIIESVLAAAGALREGQASHA